MECPEAHKNTSKEVDEVLLVSPIVGGVVIQNELS